MTRSVQDIAAEIAELRPEERETVHNWLAVAVQRDAKTAVAKTSAEGLETLKALADRLGTSEEFAVGDVVYWKPGLRNRRSPMTYDEPGVVLAVLDPPLISSGDESGSAYFREPLSLQLGLLDDDAELITYHYDGRRFTKTHPQK